MNSERDLVTSGRRIRGHNDGSSPRKKIDSDFKDYKQMKRPNESLVVRVPNERWDEWENLRQLLGNRRDTTHATVINWLLDNSSSQIDELRKLNGLKKLKTSQDDESTIDTTLGVQEDPFLSSTLQRKSLHPSEDGVIYDESKDKFYEYDDEDGYHFHDGDPTCVIALGKTIKMEEGIDGGENPETFLHEEFDSQFNDNPVEKEMSTMEESVNILTQKRIATTAFFDHHLVQRFVSQLRPRCHIEGCTRTPTVEHIKEFQQIWSIKITCGMAKHDWTFLSGELEPNRGTPLITTKLYHSTLCSGLTFTSLVSLTRSLGVHVPNSYHWFDFQSGRGRSGYGWISAVNDQWKEVKQATQQDIKKKLHQRRAIETDPKLTGYLDCLWDSSRGGYHGRVSILDVEDNKVIEMVTIDRKQENNSWLMEDTGARIVLEELQKNEIQMREIIHDDKTSIDTIVTQFGILNQKDLWHKSKNLIKSFVTDLVKAVANVDIIIDTVTSRSDLQASTSKDLKAWLKGKGVKRYSKLNKEGLIHKVADHIGLPSETIRSQKPSRLLYPELSQHDMAYKLKTWFYVCCRTCKNRGGDSTSLAFELANCADHWAGDHVKCMTLSDRPCHHIGETGAKQLDLYYPKDGRTHLAMKEFMATHITAAKMQFYTMARENYMSETFHSLIGKYASKRIHYLASHKARCHCAAMDWNENIGRRVKKIYSRKPVNIAVRNRPARTRVLVERTTYWKDKILQRVLDARTTSIEHPDFQANQVPMYDSLMDHNEGFQSDYTTNQNEEIPHFTRVLQNDLEAVHILEENVTTFQGESSTRRTQVKYIVYPSKDNEHAIQVPKTDLRLLEPGEWLNDTLVDFYVQYIQRPVNMSVDLKSTFHFYGSLFFTKLNEIKDEKEFFRTMKWTKGTNIFEKQYLIFPIIALSHWSVTIICHPCGTNHDNDSQRCLIHLDSLPIGGHDTKNIFTLLKKYLKFAWEFHQKESMDLKFFDMDDFVEEKIEVPAQQNSNDCGVFTLLYIEKFVKHAPTFFKLPVTDIDPQMFGKTWFSTNEARKHRQDMLLLLSNLFEETNDHDEPIRHLKKLARAKRFGFGF